MPGATDKVPLVAGRCLSAADKVPLMTESFPSATDKVLLVTERLADEAQAFSGVPEPHPRDAERFWAVVGVGLLAKRFKAKPIHCAD